MIYKQENLLDSPTTL